MNQTPDIAKGLLANPPQELRELLGDPRTTDEARQAVAELTSPPASQPPASTMLEAAAALPPASQPNGSSVAAVKELTNRSGDGQLQIVNETQEFTYVDRYSPISLGLDFVTIDPDPDPLIRTELSSYLGKWGMLDKGFAYDVVSVFGSQSTGKSTLLNRLFGTSFDVMDETKRQQTTKGIWMCPSAYSSTLVMDVEGTDGRKSALFSLASTEVLIVNLW
jgi:hypothetical protein